MSAPRLSIRDRTAVARAVAALQEGGLIIIPTDTIYGIAALPDRPAAIERLYAVRERAPEPATPLLLAQGALMERLAHTTPLARLLARRFWPGPLSLLLPPGAALPSELRGKLVALRVPGLAALTPLLEAVGGYLFVSGAIRAGHSPAITAPEAAELFAETVALILDGGPAIYGLPSTIVNCVVSPPVLVRRGVIPEEKLRDYLAGEAV